MTRLLAALGITLAVLALGLYAVDLARYASLSHFEANPPGGDFPQFYASAKLVLRGLPEGPYWPELLSRTMGEIDASWHRVIEGYRPHNNPLYYPPIFLLFLMPFGLLPFVPALLAFFASTAAVFFAGLRQLGAPLWLCGLLLGFSGVWLNLVSGQNGLLTAGLFALALGLLNRNQWLAGLCIGLLCYKPHLGLLWPLVLVAGGYWRAFASAAATVLALLGFTLWVYGFEVWVLSYLGQEFAANVLATKADLWQRMPTLYAFLRYQDAPYAPALWAQLFLGLFALLAVWRVWRRTDELALRAMALGCAVTLLTPFIFDYDFALLAIVLVGLVLHLHGQRWSMGQRALGILLFLWPVLIHKIAAWLAVLTNDSWQLGFVLPLLTLLWVLGRLPVKTQVAPPALTGLKA